MTRETLDGLLPGWEQMSEPEARAACKRLDPDVRREAFRTWWWLAIQVGVQPAPKPAPKKKKAKAKKEVTNGD